MARLPSGEVALNPDPDQEVQARLRLVFSSFAALGSANAVVRHLRRHQLPLRSRLLRGPSPHPIAWDLATSSTVLAISHNPAYAGAYVYGQSTRDPARAKRPGVRPCARGLARGVGWLKRSTRGLLVSARRAQCGSTAC